MLVPYRHVVRRAVTDLRPVMYERRAWPAAGRCPGARQDGTRLTSPAASPPSRACPSSSCRRPRRAEAAAVCLGRGRRRSARSCVGAQHERVYDARRDRHPRLATRVADRLNRAISSAFDPVADRFDLPREPRRCAEWWRFPLRMGGAAAVAQWVRRRPSAAPGCDQP